MGLPLRALTDDIEDIAIGLTENIGRRPLHRAFYRPAQVGHGIDGFAGDPMKSTRANRSHQTAWHEEDRK
jgi:hypothetical protein